MPISLVEFLKFRLFRHKIRQPDFLKYSQAYDRKMRDRFTYLSILLVLVSLALFFQSIFFMSLAFQITYAISTLVLANCLMFQKKFHILADLTCLVSYFIMLLVSISFLGSVGEHKAHYKFESQKGYFFLGVFSTIFEMLLINVSHPWLSLLQTAGTIIYYSTLWGEDQSNIYFFISVSVFTLILPTRLLREWRNIGKFLKKESKAMELQIFRFIVEKIETNSLLTITLNKNTRSLFNSSQLEASHSKNRKSTFINPDLISGVKIKEGLELKVVYRNKEAELKLGLKENKDTIALLSSLIIINSRQTNWACQNMSASSLGEENPLINAKNKNVDEEQVFDRSVTFKDNVNMLSELVDIYTSQLKERTIKIEKQQLPNICMEYVCASSGRSPEVEKETDIVSKTALRLFIKVLPFFLNEEISFFIFINDISEQVQNAKLKALDKYKDQVLATVTHDLRTPISVILQSLDMMYQTSDQDGAFLKWLHTCRVNGQLLNSLINDILDYAKVKEGKISLCLQSHPISEIMKEIKYMFDFQAGLKNIYFKIIYDSSIPSDIYIDKDRLKQIIINLLTNAFKFTNKGGVTLQFSLHKKTQKKEQIRVSIRDTGSGINKKIIPKLFKPFATFKTENNENKKGIGLGLVICKSLASILGPKNRIFLKSQEGVGSTFWFFIYYKREDHISNNLETKLKTDANPPLYSSILEDQMTMQKVFGLNKPVNSDEEEEGQNSLSDSSDFEESNVPFHQEVSFKSTDFKTMPKSNTIGSGSYQTYTTSSIKSKLKRTLPHRQSTSKNVEFIPSENADSIEASFFQRDRERIFKKNTILKHSSIMGYIREENTSRIRKSTHFENLNIPRSETTQFIGDSPKAESKLFPRPDMLKINSLTLVNDGDPIMEESNENIQIISEKENNSKTTSSVMENSEVFLIRKLNSKGNQAMIESLPEILDIKFRREYDSLQEIDDEIRTKKDKDERKYYLIVDDSAFNHQLYEGQLMEFNARRNYQTKTAYSGQEALELIENKINYDHSLPFLIIMDFEMPQMDGPTATKKIREILKQNLIDPIPIIGITGHSDPTVLQKGRESGMNTILKRPVSRQDFVDTIEKIVKN